MRTLAGSAPSRWPSGSVVSSDWPDCQYSVPVLVLITFGQLPRAVQRARMPSVAPVIGSVWVSNANGKLTSGKRDEAVAEVDHAVRLGEALVEERAARSRRAG